MTYSVIQCFTGAVGTGAIRLIQRDPRVELAGLYVHHESKEGIDAGTLAGIDPIGVAATCDLATLIEAGADCALWNGPWDEEKVCQLLRGGINVYSGNHAYFLRHQPDFTRLQEACRQGDTTLAAGGNIPGLISDVVPLFLSGYSGAISQIRAWQRNHVPELPSADGLSAGVGFGQPCDRVDETSAALDRGWAGALQQSAEMVADGIGTPLDRFELTERVTLPAREDLFLEPSGLTIAKGTAAGVRRTFTGWSGGRPFYVMNVEMTVALDLGPGWRSSIDDPNWRIEIDGEPDIVAEISLPFPLGESIRSLNAARAVNMVSRVVEAPIGCQSILEFPAATGSSTI